MKEQPEKIEHMNIVSSGKFLFYTVSCFVHVFIVAFEFIRMLFYIFVYMETATVLLSINKFKCAELVKGK